MRIKQLTRAVVATGALLAMLGSASLAQAASLRWAITNSFGSTITLDRATCTNGSSISPPFSIANGGTATVNVTTIGTTDSCNIRYQSSNGTYGCQFQVQASPSGGFASANAYKGSGSSPKCPYSDLSSPGAGSGRFTFSP